MNRVLSKIPFVGLHAHSVAGSPFDGLGYPQEHMDFAYTNGSEALALTDHGNANGLSYQVLHAKKMNAEGRTFKPIYGVEAYFIPSIDEWKSDYEKQISDKKNSSKVAGDSQGTVFETEERKSNDSLKRRRHLILLAQNQTGLNNIFSLISKSFKPENFYRFPRIDYNILAQHSEGIIAASACLGGVYANDMWENKDKGPNAILSAMRDTTSKMKEIFGDRWYAELQWNSIPEQHELNKYVIQIAQEMGVELISTADSHYPTPDAWKDRILYKKLGWLGEGKDIDTQIPSNVESVGYELYPKNGDQMWESYKFYSEKLGTKYDDEVVMKSLTNTHHIAFSRIDNFMPDNTVRLPSFVVPEGMTAEQALKKYAADGLRKFIQ